MAVALLGGGALSRRDPREGAWPAIWTGSSGQPLRRAPNWRRRPLCQRPGSRSTAKSSSPGRRLKRRRCRNAHPCPAPENNPSGRRWERPEAPLVTRAMSKFFFDLAGEFPARDVVGHECSSRREARQHATFIAHRIAERARFAKPGNCIEVRDSKGACFFREPIRSTF